MATTTSFTNTSSITQHHERVKEIASRVCSFYAKKTKFRISHGSTNSTRSRQAGTNTLDTSHLCNVLHVDRNKKTALVEPNVPMDRLVEATIPNGLIPPVVMEFPGITVGGGYAGTSGESSSFKHGFFNQTINSVEMVLADGEVVTCSPDHKADLFHGAAGAIGTLGVTTLVELQLHDAAKFVQTTYHPVTSAAAAIEKVKEVCMEPGVDYVDGILFSIDSGVVVAGRMTNDPAPGFRIQCFSGVGDPWFYVHAKDMIARLDSTRTDVIPLAEYLFRYDRGGFWVGRSAFEYFSCPFNRLTRWALDEFIHTRMMYVALHASGQAKRYIVQDIAFPFETAEQFVEWNEEELGIYPLWLCPLRSSPAPTMHPHIKQEDGRGELKPMLNIGLWGNGPSASRDFIRLNRDIERKTRELGGVKWLYAHQYYSEDEFWQIYDREWYDDLRRKYNATTLPTVYDKVKADLTGKEVSRGEKIKAMWPIGGIVGIAKAIRSGTYHDARKSTWPYAIANKKP